MRTFLSKKIIINGVSLIIWGNYIILLYIYSAPLNIIKSLETLLRVLIYTKIIKQSKIYSILILKGLAN